MYCSSACLVVKVRLCDFRSFGRFKLRRSSFVSPCRVKSKHVVLRIQVLPRWSVYAEQENKPYHAASDRGPPIVGTLFVMLANTTGGSGGILHHPGSVLGQCTHCSQHVKSTHFSVFFSTPRVFIEKFHMSWGELGRGPFYYGNVQDSENAPEIEILIQQKQIRLDCLYKSPAPPRRKKVIIRCRFCGDAAAPTTSHSFLP